MKTVAWGIVVCVAVSSCSRGGGSAPGGESNVAPASTTYAVSGEVNGPGEQAWKEGITLSAAIQKAGGITAKAMADGVNLVRMKQVTIHDLKKIASGEATDTPLMAGDSIVVPRVLDR